MSFIKIRKGYVMKADGGNSDSLKKSSVLFGVAWGLLLTTTTPAVYFGFDNMVLAYQKNGLTLGLAFLFILGISALVSGGLHWLHGRRVGK